MNSYQNFFQIVLTETTGQLVLNRPDKTNHFRDYSFGVYQFRQENFLFKKSFLKNNCQPKITNGEALLVEEERTLIVFSNQVIISTEDQDLVDQLIGLGHFLKEIIKRPGSDSNIFELRPTDVKILKPRLGQMPFFT